MQLARQKPQRSLISLVSMIDVLMIMLVFFMVTSTYLDLDMMPLAERGDESAPDSATAGRGAPLPQTGQNTVLVRLAADGSTHVSGRRLGASDLAARLAETPGASVVVLPSGQAETQALVSLLDLLSVADVAQVRLVRLEAQR